VDLHVVVIGHKNYLKL